MIILNNDKISDERACWEETGTGTSILYGYNIHNKRTNTYITYNPQIEMGEGCFTLNLCKDDASTIISKRNVYQIRFNLPNPGLSHNVDFSIDKVHEEYKEYKKISFNIDYDLEMLLRLYIWNINFDDINKPETLCLIMHFIKDIYDKLDFNDYHQIFFIDSLELKVN